MNEDTRSKGNVSERKYWMSQVSAKQPLIKFTHFLEEADRDEWLAYVIRTTPGVETEKGTR